MLPISIFKRKVIIKSERDSRSLLYGMYKIRKSGVSPRPGNQTSAALYRAADHSLSSTGLEETLLSNDLEGSPHGF